MSGPCTGLGLRQDHRVLYTTVTEIQTDRGSVDAPTTKAPSQSTRLA
jgi:hypothetical protein